MIWVLHLFGKPVPKGAIVRPVFLIATAIFWLVSGGCSAPSAQTFSGQPPPRAALTPREMQYARTAWAYFVVNEDPATGLMPAANKFNSTTLWDEGGYLLALTAAYRLGITSRADASRRLQRVLSALVRLPLFRGRLPNKVYNTTTLEMTDYANKPTNQGLGWSAMDIMRLFSGMLVATQEFPEHLPLAQQILNRWDLELLVFEGRFQGIAVNSLTYPKLVQEGRIGYEQYAGRIGLLIGMPVELASRYAPILRIQKYHDIILPGDIRTGETHGISSITTSEPFLLEALEFGWRRESRAVAAAVYQAQMFRYRQTGQLTALSEDHIKGKPYFAYNAVLVDYIPFVSVTSQRKDVSEKRGLSTKASFGWWALVRDEYSQKLLRAVEHLQSDRGWYAGLFESDNSPNKALSMNTNAVVLEALHYKVFGPMFRQSTAP